MQERQRIYFIMCVCAALINAYPYSDWYKATWLDSSKYRPLGRDNKVMVVITYANGSHLANSMQPVQTPKTGADRAKHVIKAKPLNKAIEAGHTDKPVTQQQL